MEVVVDIGTEGQGKLLNLTVRREKRANVLIGVKKKRNHLLDTIHGVLQSLFDFQHQDLQRSKTDPMDRMSQIGHDGSLQFLHDVRKGCKTRDCVQQLRQLHIIRMTEIDPFSVIARGLGDESWNILQEFHDGL